MRLGAVLSLSGGWAKRLARGAGSPNTQDMKSGACIFRLICVCLVLVACESGVGRIGGGKVFVPRVDFGIAPDVKSYTQPGACQGGAQLAAVDVSPPEYPRRAFNNGQQGWVVVRLDVDAEGRTRNVTVLDAEPLSVFNAVSKRTVKSWVFAPPQQPLTGCVVVLDYRFGVARIGL